MSFDLAHIDCVYIGDWVSNIYISILSLEFVHDDKSQRMFRSCSEWNSYNLIK